MPTKKQRRTEHRESSTAQFKHLVGYGRPPALLAIDEARASSKAGPQFFSLSSSFPPAGEPADLRVVLALAFALACRSK